jgi:hypothetical protein
LSQLHLIHSVLLKKRIQFLAELLRKHRERASARLIEDALAVSLEYLVNGCRRNDLLGNRAVIAVHQGQDLARNFSAGVYIGGRAQCRAVVIIVSTVAELERTL